MGPVEWGAAGCAALCLAQQVTFVLANWDLVDAIWIPTFTSLRILTLVWHWLGSTGATQVHGPLKRAVLAQKTLEAGHVWYSAYIRTAVLLPAWDSQLQGPGVYLLTLLVAIVDQVLMTPFAPTWFIRSAQIVHGIGGAGCILLQSHNPSWGTRLLVLLASLILMAVLPELLTKRLLQQRSPSLPAQSGKAEQSQSPVDPIAAGSCSATTPWDTASEAPVAQMSDKTSSPSAIKSPAAPRAGPMLSPPRKSTGTSYERTWLDSQTDVTRMLTGEVIARPPAIMARPVPSTYKSHLGQRIKVCIKLKTNLPLSSMPPELATVMAHGLSQMDPGPGKRLLDMSARSGCIMLTFDCIDIAPGSAQPQTDAASPVPGQHASSATATARQLAVALLPSLMPVLNHDIDCIGKHAGQLAHAGTSSMVLQVGDALLSVSCDGPDGDWLMQTRHELSQPAKLSHQPPSVTSLSASTSSSSACMLGAVRQTTLARNSGGTGGGAAVQRVCIDAQVLGCVHDLRLATGWTHPDNSSHTRLTGSSSVATTSSAAVRTPGPCAAHMAAAISGSQVVQAGGAAVGVPGSRLPVQVLVACAGQYLSTHLVDCRELDAVDEVMFKVHVDVPERVWPRHHKGGDCLGFLPVEVQLWRGEVLLSSASLVLMKTPAGGSAAAAAAATSPAPCWWWGAAPDVLQAALLELQQMDRVLWEAQTLDNLPRSSKVAMLEYTRSHHVFVRDLATWWAGVRDTARLTGKCSVDIAELDSYDGSAPGVKLHTPELPVEVLMSLGSCLCSHAASLGLQNVQHMVQQQLNSVISLAAAAALAPASTAVVTGGCSPAAPSSSSSSSCSSVCSRCDAVWRSSTIDIFSALPGISIVILAMTVLACPINVIIHAVLCCSVIVWKLVLSKAQKHGLMNNTPLARSASVLRLRHLVASSPAVPACPVGSTGCVPGLTAPACPM